MRYAAGGTTDGESHGRYASMDQEDAGTYAEVRRAILQRYEVNEETHRLRFRKERRGAEETYREWSHRLHEHFGRWRKDRDIPLEELILIEQFMAGVPQDLTVWLRERKPKSLREAAEQADNYVAARKAEGRSEGSRGEFPQSARGGQQSDPRPTVEVSGRMRPQSATGGSVTKDERDKQCFVCREWGHVSYNCPKAQRAQVTEQTKAFYAGGCPEQSNCKDYVRSGSLDGNPVQMLIDTGCDRTMVVEELVDPSKIDRTKTAQVLCVHGHAELYPTARVSLRIEGHEGEVDVIVAPRLPTVVLLGRDITGQSSGVTANAFAVSTWSQTGQGSEEEADSSHLDEPAGVDVQELRGEVDSNRSTDLTELELLEPETPVVACNCKLEFEPGGRKGTQYKEFPGGWVEQLISPTHPLKGGGVSQSCTDFALWYIVIICNGICFFSLSIQCISLCIPSVGFVHSVCSCVFCIECG